MEHSNTTCEASTEFIALNRTLVEWTFAIFIITYCYINWGLTETEVLIAEIKVLTLLITKIRTEYGPYLILSTPALTTISLKYFSVTLSHMYLGLPS